MVAGGFSGGSYLDSTEVFSDNIWSSVDDAKLPVAMDGLRIATINNMVLAFGNSLF